MKDFKVQGSVTRWLVNIPNQRTQRVYLYALKKFSEFSGESPNALINLGEKNEMEAHNLLKTFYNSLDLASTSKMMLYQAIRSFYRANGVVLGRKPQTFRTSVEYESRKLYNQDDVATLVDAATHVRDKALITFLAQSGQRVGVIASLKIQHIEIRQTPLIVEVPAILRNKYGINVNKAQTPYRFAIGEDTKKYIDLMIQDRKKRGEHLKPDSWLFRSYSARISCMNIRKVARSTPGEPLSTSQIGNIVRKAAEERGLQRRFGKRYLFHPHGFRRYWKHQLRMGGVDPDLLDHMMGHVTAYGGAYDMWTIEDIRKQYKTAENYISLRPIFTVTKEEVREEVLKIILGRIKQEDLDIISKNLGIPPLQILSLTRTIAK